VNKVVVIGLVAVVVGGIGATVHVLGGREREAAVVERLGEASRCVATGHYDDELALALALRHKHRADAELDGARAWPRSCTDAIARLGDAVEKWRDDDAGLALGAAVAKLKDASTATAIPELAGSLLEPVRGALLGVWQAAAAAGIDVKAAVPAGKEHARPPLTLEALAAMPAFTDGAVRLTVLGSHQQDSRHARYMVLDEVSGAVSGFCSLPFDGAGLCSPLPQALRGPKTQLLGYSEPAALPLIYAQDEGRVWSVYRADDGARLFTGYAGGAWTSEGYAASVTDDKGREDRIVVLEQKKGAPITRRTIELKDIDPDATRVGQAIVIWSNVLVRTKREGATGSSFYCLPLPLAEGAVKAAKVGEGAAVDFCRSKDAVYVTGASGSHAYRDGAWRPAADARCEAIEVAESPLFATAGALWLRKGDDADLFFDPLFADGAFLGDSRMTSWSEVPPRSLLIEVAERVYLLEIAPGGEVRAVAMKKG
jgi:hypothetical protein